MMACSPLPLILLSLRQMQQWRHCNLEQDVYQLDKLSLLVCAMIHISLILGEYLCAAHHSYVCKQRSQVAMECESVITAGSNGKFFHIVSSSHCFHAQFNILQIKNTVNMNLCVFNCKYIHARLIFKRSTSALCVCVFM